MKNLIEYINESLLDDEEDLIKDDKILVEQWVEKYVHLIKNDWEYKDGKINFYGTLSFNKILSEENVTIPKYIKFDKVYGTVNLSNRLGKYLNDLSWFPEYVDGSVYLDGTNISSFKNIPLKTVNGSFCADKTNIKTLEGLENVTVTTALRVCECAKLTSLKYCPKGISDITCYMCNSLKSLEGCPEEINGDLNCSYCNSLKSLEGCPKKINGSLFCAGCKSLKSLEGCPEILNALDCGNCSSLKSLEGGPKKTKYQYDCAFCTSIVSLKGCAEEIGTDFNCKGCDSLKSLEGYPKKVGEIFDCRKNKNLILTPEDIKELKQLNKTGAIGKLKYK